MKPDFLILAAGKGSRFRGPKQLTPVGPSGEPLLAYTIHDAARAGFGRVVLVCPETLGATMAETFRSCTGDVIEITAVEQLIPVGRSKPWGTAHAVLEAASTLGGSPFGVANGDDWYGPSALVALAEALKEPDRTDHLIVTYELARTLVFTDGVSRGECDVEDRHLRRVREVFDVRRGEGSCTGNLSDGTPVTLATDTPVSMNLWGFAPSFLGALAERWTPFHTTVSEECAAPWEGTDSEPSPRSGIPHPPSEPEFLLPHVITDLIDENKATVQAVTTDECPFGLTRPEDLDTVRAEIARHVAIGHYPADLRTGIA